jgi:hypothetical protein
VAQTGVAKALTAGGSSLGARGGTALLRGVGGGAAGGVVAPVITLGTMFYQDITNPLYNPTGADYFAKGGRAMVVGGLSGALASAATFALFGATLGPLGILAGFIIGMAMYYMVDEIAGDFTERQLRRPFQ